MTVGPDEEQRGKQPQPPSRFQHRHGRREPNERHQKRPALLKMERHTRRGERGRKTEDEVRGSVKDHPADQRAKADEQHRTRENEPGKPGSGVDQVHSTLRQPLVREIEVSGDLLAGAGSAHPAGVGERIGNGQRASLESVLPGLEMQPDVGIANFAREQREQKDCGRQQQDSRPPALQKHILKHYHRAPAT